MALVRSIAGHFRQWLSGRSSEAPHILLGRRGEERATSFLKSVGFKILRRNFRAPTGGEIDIVCRDGEILVFVEVKTRSSEDFGRPISAVDRKKRRLIIRAAMAWLRMLDMPDTGFRFDVIEIVGDEIRHIENAFNLPRPYHY